MPTMNAIVSALRFFFIHTLNRPDLARRLVASTSARPARRAERRRGRASARCHGLPDDLAALSLAYGAGLRVAEVAASGSAISTRPA